MSKLRSMVAVGAAVAAAATGSTLVAPGPASAHTGDQAVRYGCGEWYEKRDSVAVKTPAGRKLGYAILARVPGTDDFCTVTRLWGEDIHDESHEVKAGLKGHPDGAFLGSQSYVYHWESVKGSVDHRRVYFSGTIWHNGVKAHGNKIFTRAN